MFVGVLGDLVLTHGGRDLVPSAPKARQLLALLVLKANKLVLAEECIEELWASEPPKSAMSTLQTYVVQIRRALRSARPQHLNRMLVTKGPGYQLDVDRTRTDWWMFEDLVSRGRAAVASGRDERASALFRAALRIWRGRVLADVPTGPHTLPHVIELGETRQYALEQRIDADLRLGRHASLIEQLVALAVKHPTNENVQAQLMLGLYRSGRRSRALAVFDTLRETLADSLGIEPSPRMQRLHQAIVAQERTIDLVRGSEVPPVGGGTPQA